MENLKFQDLNLSKDLFSAVQSMGFETTTPIQAQAIPVVLAGSDVVGLASTGTGKTAAFGLPAIEKIDGDSKKIQTLILCPTRELAMQVAVEMNKFLRFKRNVSALPIYGGQDIRRQIFALRRGPQIIIGTPGRVMDHMERGTLNFKHVNMVVLDEADEMLNMGFRQDIEQILKTVNKERQTLLFSATMSPEIMQITKRFQKEPKVIRVAAKQSDLTAIEQSYFDIGTPYKIDMLMDLINKHEPKRAIVFCNTKRMVDKVAKTLFQTGFSSAGIHGDIRQAKRDAIMARFRGNKIKILIATDVAARGIDVNDVEIVFNFEIPRETESYVHRIGRTGRAGKKGKAFSFVSPVEMRQFRNIVRFTNADIKKDNGQNVSSSKPKEKVFSDVKKDDTPIARVNRVKERSFSESNFKQDFQEDNHLEKKAAHVLKQVKATVSSDEHSLYLDLAESFVGRDLSTQDLSAALLKILVDSDKNKRRPVRRFQR